VILKAKHFSSSKFDSEQELALFVNSNNIKREDIFIITQSITNGDWRLFTLFYYAEE